MDYDYEYDKDDFIWNPKTAMWEATDGELFEQISYLIIMVRRHP